MTDVRELIERIPAAIKATEYKYFGDYEMSDGQRDAVDVLVQAATALTAALEREEALREALERMEGALETARQFALEVHGAQSRGAEWYTRGASGLYQQVDMWRRKTDAAVQDAISAYSTALENTNGN